MLHFKRTIFVDLFLAPPCTGRHQWLRIYELELGLHRSRDTGLICRYRFVITVRRMRISSAFKISIHLVGTLMSTEVSDLT